MKNDQMQSLEQLLLSNNEDMKNHITKLGDKVDAALGVSARHDVEIVNIKDAVRESVEATRDSISELSSTMKKAEESSQLVEREIRDEIKNIWKAHQEGINLVNSTIKSVKSFIKGISIFAVALLALLSTIATLTYNTLLKQTQEGAEDAIVEQVGAINTSVDQKIEPLSKRLDFIERFIQPE